MHTSKGTGPKQLRSLSCVCTPVPTTVLRSISCALSRSTTARRLQTGPATASSFNVSLSLSLSFFLSRSVVPFPSSLSHHSYFLYNYFISYFKTQQTQTSDWAVASVTTSRASCALPAHSSPSSAEPQVDCEGRAVRTCPQGPVLLAAAHTHTRTHTSISMPTE